MTEDPDWYLDHVVVPGDIERHPVGPVRAWRGSWDAARAALEQAELPGPRGNATRLALSQGFVLTRAQARTCGLTDADIRRFVARSEWSGRGHGVVSVETPRPSDGFDAERRAHTLRSAAAALARPGHVVSTGSAAVLHGLPTLGVPEVPELLARSPTTTGRRSATRIRHLALSESEIDSWFGVAVTDVARTVVDLARFDPAGGLMAADAALHESVVRAEDIATSLAAASGGRWIRRAQAALAIASPLIESPLESITHLALHRAGFPPPLLQARLPGADGRTYRADFHWPHARFVLEADGRGKYTDGALWAEKRREQALTRTGLRVGRVVWADIVTRWAETEAWLREELRRTR